MQHADLSLAYEQEHYFQAKNHFKLRKPGENLLKLDTLLLLPKNCAFETQLSIMNAKLLIASMSYLEKNWLVYEEELVSTFLRNRLHHGHITTSRVESAHAALKNWIRVSTGSLYCIIILL